jgi:hypothetical protein
MAKKKKKEDRRKMDLPLGPWGNTFWHPQYGSFPNKRRKKK